MDTQVITLEIKVNGQGTGVFDGYPWPQPWQRLEAVIASINGIDPIPADGQHQVLVLSGDHPTMVSGLVTTTPELDHRERMYRVSVVGYGDLPPQVDARAEYVQEATAEEAASAGYNHMPPPTTEGLEGGTGEQTAPKRSHKRKES